MLKPSANHVLRGLFDIAESDPDRVLFTFVDEKGNDAETRTAAQLVKRIVRLSSYLSEGCGLSPGDTALMIYPPSIEFIEAFAACQLVGIIAAPVYPPNLARPQADLVRLSAIAASSGAKAMLTNRAYRWASRMSSAKEMLSGGAVHWPSLPWYVTQGLGWFHAKTERAVDCQANDVALLQFTSGSTSTPKGVRLTHGNLIHQLDLNAEILGMNQDSRMVMWVPQYHDLGLISGIMTVLRGRGSLWFMSPLSFLKSPALWFDVMHRVRATHTASPNFGYELASKKTTPEMRARWDLSSLQIFMNAAEPIVPLTMDTFLHDFAVSKLSPAAFCPAYGLAEHAVGVTLAGKARVRLDRQTLVSKRFAHMSLAGDLELFGCGKARCGVKLRIVDPDNGALQAERYVGEIWVQSASVADGYQGLPELSQQLFGATLPNEAGTWLRTGDLGFVHEDELFITGRQKDLIIIRGRNMHPEDVEESVRRVHADIRSGGVVAFSVPGKATEEMVVLLEVMEEEGPHLDEVVQTVKRRIGEVWHVQATVALVPARSLKKTTSGKIQRAACRLAWLDGHFNLLHMHVPEVKDTHLALDTASIKINLQDMPLDDRVGWLLELIRQLAQTKLSGDVSHIGPDDFLPDAGLDSLNSVELLKLIEERMNCALPNTLFIEHPTLRSAAMRILHVMGIEFLGVENEVVENEEALPFRPPHRFMPPSSTKIGIVGGGVGGLVAALELARTGYRDIVVFEASNECGGKVMTPKIDGKNIELGQNFFGDSFRSVLDLALELGCPLQQTANTFMQWDEKYGFEEPPVRRAAKSWLQAVIKGARMSMNTALPFPSMFDDLDMPFSQFLEKNKMRAPHPLFFFDWNGMGYGMDIEVSAAYVLPYLAVVGAMGSTCYLPKGNRDLWTTLAQHLAAAWGVKFVYGQQVERVEGDAQGVTLWCGGQEYRFDEAIMAVPPRQLRTLLPQNDPWQQHLSKFNYYPYVVKSFKVEGLFKEGSIFMPQFAASTGRTILIQACPDNPDWYISSQYAGDFAKEPSGQLTDDILNQETIEIVQKLGAKLIEFGPHKTWDYFPHLRENAVQTLRQIEASQGERHIWGTGSWLAFEATEHVARHARHLVRTCFDPAFTADRAQEAMLDE
jgi:acyl-CoA synthetase (AMP-forming)/AMP-acid ligase II/acyl carrier protein